MVVTRSESLKTNQPEPNNMENYSSNESGINLPEKHSGLYFLT